ncbi:MAG: Trm112 family protein [Pseudohongiellaceae bacterium]|nr:Trm112 family protein [Pseudohongiellaceae bacterium]
MDKKLLSILACPICKGDLTHKPQDNELICYADALAFPIRDDMPVMLVDEARTISAEEREQR